jgi:hypothetical protein
MWGFPEQDLAVRRRPPNLFEREPEDEADVPGAIPAAEVPNL